jgi:ABC-type bacteriocin/lantibiotic exporter with double-glycine peptidase domain
VTLELERYPQSFASEEFLGRTWGGMDHRYWEERTCGLACLRTIFAFYGFDVPTQGILLRQALELKAYVARGWAHHGLVRLARIYGLDGIAVQADSLEILQALADRGMPSIVSCALYFPIDGRRGGHLVVFGGRGAPDGTTVVVCDPSSWGHDHHEVSAEAFWSSSTGRAIVLWPLARRLDQQTRALLADLSDQSRA